MTDVSHHIDIVCEGIHVSNSLIFLKKVVNLLQPLFFQIEKYVKVTQCLIDSTIWSCQAVVVLLSTLQTLIAEKKKTLIQVCFFFYPLANFRGILFLYMQK